MAGYDAACLAETVPLVGPGPECLRAAADAGAALRVEKIVDPDYVFGVRRAIAELIACADGRADGPKDILLAAASRIERRLLA